MHAAACADVPSFHSCICGCLCSARLGEDHNCPAAAVNPKVKPSVRGWFSVPGGGGGPASVPAETGQWLRIHTGAPHPAVGQHSRCKGAAASRAGDVAATMPQFRTGEHSHNPACTHHVCRTWPMAVPGSVLAALGAAPGLLNAALLIRRFEGPPHQWIRVGKPDCPAQAHPLCMPTRGSPLACRGVAVCQQGQTCLQTCRGMAIASVPCKPVAQASQSVRRQRHWPLANLI